MGNNTNVGIEEKIKILNDAICMTRNSVTKTKTICAKVNSVYAGAGEPYPLPTGGYTRRLALLADLERMMEGLL